VSNIILANRPNGPIIRVAINVSKPKQDALTAAGTPIPNWVPVDFLVDTGASITMLDQTIPPLLGLAHHSFTMMLTPTTGTVPVPCKTYDIGLFIPGPTGGAGHYEEAMPVVESDLSAQSIGGLLGRDVLAKCVLTYVGQSDIFILSY
jgi:hypothetical protein